MATFSVTVSILRLDAWDHYLRALAFRARYTAKDFAAAERELEAAIRLDPEFAAAHTELAIACVSIATIWHGESDAGLAKAMLHAQRACQLDESDAAAQSALSFAHTLAAKPKPEWSRGAALLRSTPTSHSLGIISRRRCCIQVF